MVYKLNETLIGKVFLLLNTPKRPGDYEKPTEDGKIEKQKHEEKLKRLFNVVI